MSKFASFQIMFITAHDPSKQALTLFCTCFEKVNSLKIKKKFIWEKTEYGNKTETFTGKYGDLPRSLPLSKRKTILESPFLKKQSQ